MMIRGCDERYCQMIKENGLIIDIPPLQDHIFFVSLNPTEGQIQNERRKGERGKRPLQIRWIG